jgi:hypothetical protein
MQKLPYYEPDCEHDWLFQYIASQLPSTPSPNEVASGASANPGWREHARSALHLNIQKDKADNFDHESLSKNVNSSVLSRSLPTGMIKNGLEDVIKKEVLFVSQPATPLPHEWSVPSSDEEVTWDGFEENVNVQTDNLSKCNYKWLSEKVNSFMQSIPSSNNIAWDGLEEISKLIILFQQVPSTTATRMYVGHIFAQWAKQLPYYHRGHLWLAVLIRLLSIDMKVPVADKVSSLNGQYLMSQCLQSNILQLHIRLWCSLHEKKTRKYHLPTADSVFVLIITMQLLRISMTQSKFCADTRRI